MSQEQRFNGLKVLGAVSGLGEAEARKIWEQVKVNQARLNACVGPHDFQPIEPSDKLKRDWLCSKCGGKVDMHARLWYELGLKHGRQTP